MTKKTKKTATPKVKKTVKPKVKKSIDPQYENKRYLPSTAQMMEDFTVDGTQTQESIPTKNVNSPVRKHYFHDVTPKRNIKSW